MNPIFGVKTVSDVQRSVLLLYTAITNITEYTMVYAAAQRALIHRGRMNAIPPMLFTEKKYEKRKSVYAAAQRAATRIPAGKPGEDSRKIAGGELALSRRFDGWIRKRTPKIFRSFLSGTHCM